MLVEYPQLTGVLVHLLTPHLCVFQYLAMTSCIDTWVVCIPLTSRLQITESTVILFLTDILFYFIFYF